MGKILFVIDNVYHYAGTENICNFMSEALGDDNIIDVLSLSGQGKTFYPFDNVRSIITLNDKRNKLISLATYIYKNDYDYYFVISMGKLSFLFRWVCLFLNKKNKKIFACEHVAIESFPGWIKALKINGFKWYDKVIVLTDHDYDYLRKSSIDAIKISNPISYNDLVKKTRSHIALAVGRLEHQKGFSDLIEIWDRFIEKNIDWKLFIIGDGSLKESLEEKIKLKKLESSVFLLGKQSDVAKYYEECDLLLMTSHYEGLPLVLLEAKSWSLPVIAFDCPTGPKEIIDNGIDGFLISNRNNQSFVEHLNMIANDDVLYFNMSSATKETYKKFDVVNIKQQWLNLIKKR